MNSASTSNISAMDAQLDYHNHTDQNLSVRELNKRLTAVRAAKYQSIYIKDFEENLASEEYLLGLLSNKQQNDQSWAYPLMMGFSKLAVVIVLILVVCFWGSFILDKLMSTKNELMSPESARNPNFQLSANQASVKST